MTDNADKSYYDNDLLEGQAGNYVPQIEAYARAWLKPLAAELGRDQSLQVLDLGAGSCTTSLLISREPYVARVAAADISAARLQIMSRETNTFVNGDLTKLSYHAIDFNEPLPFADNEFGLVVMDAALHHSRNIWETLAEIRRVLKPGGLFVAQREAYTSPLTNRVTFKRLLESPEVAAGVSENAYLPSQYDYYLRANGFVPRFLPVYERVWQKALFFLNGIVFSKFNIVSRSTKAA